MVLYHEIAETERKKTSMVIIDIYLIYINHEEYINEQIKDWHLRM